jgi:hypothetical protein
VHALIGTPQLELPATDKHADVIDTDLGNPPGLVRGRDLVDLGQHVASRFNGLIRSKIAGYNVLLSQPLAIVVNSVELP